MNIAINKAWWILKMKHILDLLLFVLGKYYFEILVDFLRMNVAQ